LTLPLFTACGGQAADESDEYDDGGSYDRQSAGYDAVPQEPRSDSEVSKEYDSNAYDDIYDSDSTAAGSPNSVDPVSGKVDGRKEIKTGTLELSVKEVAESYKELAKLVKSLGGYEFSKNEYQSTYGIAYDFTVKIPPAKLSEFEAGLHENFGDDEITRYVLNSEDITADYNDTAIRLKSLKKTHEQFLEILKKANTVKEIMEVQKEISNIESDIDQAEGRIRMWDKLVEYATIDISIKSNETQIEQSWQFETGSDVFNAMGNGFVSVAKNTGSVVLWILIAIVSALPVLIPAAGIVILLIYLSRRKKRQIAEGKRKPKEKKAPKAANDSLPYYPPPNQKDDKK